MVSARLMRCHQSYRSWRLCYCIVVQLLHRLSCEITDATSFSRKIFLMNVFAPGVVRGAEMDRCWLEEVGAPFLERIFLVDNILRTRCSNVKGKEADW